MPLLNFNVTLSRQKMQNLFNAAEKPQKDIKKPVLAGT